MAYDPKTENLAHLRHIITHLLDFNGRSQRSEFVVYLAAMFAISAVTLVLGLITSGTTEIAFDQYVQFLLWLPAIPLFVRRLHDQDRSGWWAIAMPVVLGLKLYEHIQFDAGRLTVPSLGYPYSLIEDGFALAFWVLVFWPGTDGENRFGHDPRKDLPVPAA